MKKRKFSKHIFLPLVLFILGTIIFIYSFFNICKWFIDSKKTKSIINEINEYSIITDTNFDNTTTNIDFSALNQKNSDTVGWIQVVGTEVNYPFTQTTDNDFYLTHSFDKKNNSAGWIFLDYRNNSNFADRNSIIYAHGRLDNTMFGSLKHTLDENWLNDSSSHKINIFSQNNPDTTWEIFSVYHIPATDDYTKVTFKTDDEFSNFINMIKNRSVYNFNVNINASDNIITLSTCYNNNSNERMVVHAKLIK